MGVLGEILSLGTLLLSASGALKNTKSDYYFFFGGRSTGVFLGTLFTSIDRWFNLDIISHTNAWERFK